MLIYVHYLIVNKYKYNLLEKTDREVGHNKPKVPATYMEQTHKTMKTQFM